MILKIFGREVRTGNDRIEVRSGMPVGSGISGGNLFSSFSNAGTDVNVNSALKISAVVAAVRNIGDDVAKLPIGIYRKDDKGNKSKLTTSPINWVLNVRPMRGITPFSSISSLVSTAILKGNAYQYIIRDTYGRVSGLKPINPESVTILVDEFDNITYRIMGTTYMGFQMRTGTYSSDDIVHIPGLTLNGIVGLPVLAYLSDVFGGAIALQDLSNNYFRNGTNLGGTFETEADLSADTYARLASQLQSWSGPYNSGVVPLLGNGIKYKPVASNAKDAQLVEARQYAVVEIARALRIPLHKIQDLNQATFSNIEELNIDYTSDTLLPWITKIEQEYASKLIPESDQLTDYINIDVSELLRGNLSAQTEYVKMQVQNGLWTTNEARQYQNMNKIEGGDHRYIAVNMAMVGKDGELTPIQPAETTPATEQKPKPAPSN